MRRKIRLSEKDLTKLIKKIVFEQEGADPPAEPPPGWCQPGTDCKGNLLADDGEEEEKKQETDVDAATVQQVAEYWHNRRKQRQKNLRNL